mgnify:CR=1 FL=1
MCSDFFVWRLIKKNRESFWFICGEDGSLYFLKIKRPLLVFKSVLMQRNFFKSLRDECTKISESTIGDSDKLKWVTNWCQFLFQDQKMIRSHIIGNIRKVLIEETSETDFELPLVTLSPCVFSPLGLSSLCQAQVSCVCDAVTGAEPWQLNPATKSLSLATSLPICRCRIPAILLPVIVLCKVVLCQIRFTSYNFVPSFKACVVHHITLLSDSTALLNLFCNLLTSTNISITGCCGVLNNEADYLSQDNLRLNGPISVG